MPSPSASLATLRPDLGGSLEQFDLAADRAGFVGHRILPLFESAAKIGNYGRIPLAQLLQNRDTQRSPGSGYARGSFTFDPQTFACQEHGAEEPLDDDEAEIYASYFDAERIASQRAMDAVLRNAEKRVVSTVLDAAVWTGAPLTTAAGTAWSTIATAVPVTDVEAACRKVFDGCGMWPNAIALSKKKFRDARRCAQVIDMSKGQSFQDVRPGNITAENLAVVFDLKHVFVAGSAKNTATEGQAAVAASIWDDTQAIVFKVAEGKDIKEPCLGRTIYFRGGSADENVIVEEYRDEAIRSNVYRARHDVAEKVLYIQASHRLTGL